MTRIGDQLSDLREASGVDGEGAGAKDADGSDAGGKDRDVCEIDGASAGSMRVN